MATKEQHPRIGPYVLTEPLAVGGGGAVWLARHVDDPASDAQWVVKLASGDQVAALAAEWRALVTIPLAMLPEAAWFVRHVQGLHGLLDVTAQTPVAALVLRRAAGETLDTCLRGASMPVLYAVTRALLDGLAVLHAAGWVHGDLHPGNVLVHAENGQLRVMLLDLGLAERVGQPVAGPGRLACAAPQRLRGDVADPRDDLFAVAMALWLAWRGESLWPRYPLQLPQSGQIPQVDEGLAAGVDPAWLAMVRACVAAEREHRPQGAAAALRAWLGEQAEADAARVHARGLAALAHRSVAWRDDDPVDDAGTSRWRHAPAGAGRTGWLLAAALRADQRDEPWAWLTATVGGAVQLCFAHQDWRWQPDVAAAPAVFGDRTWATRTAAAQWLAAALKSAAPAGLLLVEDAAALPDALRTVLQQQDLVQSLGWRVAGVDAHAPQAVLAGADWAPLPPADRHSVQAWLQAATGGLRWDGQLADTMIDLAHGHRRQVLQLAADALGRGIAQVRLGAVRWQDARQGPAQLRQCVHPDNAPTAQGWPDAQTAAAAVARLEAAGDWSTIVAQVDTWLPGELAKWSVQPGLSLDETQDGPQLVRVAASYLLACGALGQTAVARATMLTWPAVLQAQRSVVLAAAELAFRAGDYPQCRAHVQALLAVQPDDADALLWLAFAATWQGDRPAALAAMAHLDAVSPVDGERRDLLLYLQGLHHYYAGQLAQADAHLRSLLPRAQGGLRAAVLGGLGLVAHRRGDLTQAREYYGQAASQAESVGDAARALNMDMNVAVVDHEAGDLGLALAGYDRVVQRAEAVGNAGAVARAQGNRGNLLTGLGLFADARRDLDAALPVLIGAGNAHLQGNVRCLLAEIARHHTDLAEAATQLDLADAALDRAGAATERLEIQLERGQACLASGEVDAAQAAADVVLGQALAGGHGELQGRARVLRVQSAMRTEVFQPFDTAQLPRWDEDLRAALAQLPTSKPLHRTLATSLLVQVLIARGLVMEARDVAADQQAVLRRVAATLSGSARTAFERTPGDAAPRELLSAIAQLPAQAQAMVAGARPALLTTLLAINRRLGEQHDMAQILETVMDSAILLTGAERGFLLVDDGDWTDPPEVRAARLRVGVARNLDRENLKKPQQKLSHSVAEQVFASGEAVLAIDAQLDARFADTASVHAGSLRSILCVPLRASAGVLGCIYVDNRFAAGAFTQEHGTLLSGLGDQAAIALQTAKLLAQLRETAHALEKSRVEVEQLNARLLDQLTAVETELVGVRADLDAQRLAIARRSDYAQIKGESPQLRRLFGLMDRVRDHDFAVLITGESGTGKELVARAIHFTGRRQRGPFVAINCGALPSNLLESELFGHVRGAFTGAVAERRGLFEAASGGTLLLDEVGEMPLEMQVKLLRVLQTHEITRVGESTLRKVDVRVVAATHRDLAAMVRAGTFREDLLYRLQVVELPIPALRQRPGDIALLVEHFLHENRLAGVGRVVRISRAALSRLTHYAWPGNIRQLEMVLKAACLFADGDTLDLPDLEHLLTRERATDPPTLAAAQPDGDWLTLPLQALEQRLIAQRIAHFGGNKRRAADSLGIDRGTLYNRLRDGGDPWGEG